MPEDTEKQFSYECLPGTHLLQKLTKPNGMSLSQSDLLTGMAYHHGSTLVAQRAYTYDTLGPPLSRSTARNGQTVNDTFGYNNRSELITATVNGGSYAYDYDNIGNRLSGQSSAGAEADAAVVEYTANELNQYTALAVDGVTDFLPEYDADGNQTRVKTSTGIWAISYDTENCPTDFTGMAADNTITTVHCEYDSMGRRAIKRVMVNGNVTLHQRYIYRGYLQIACIDLTRSHHPALWYITWDPTQQIATRPLAIQKDGTWYTYGWDLTKNICEVYRTNGTLGTSYTYTPYGQVSASGSVTQPIQWSSEFNDTELGLIYYNYRHYNPVDGRWMGRDPYMERSSKCLTNYVWNSPTDSVDLLGRDRAYITFNSEHDNTFFHATLRVDNWYIINGKYKKKGYVNYDFRPIVSGINEWIAIWSILNVLATPLVATATVYKTTAAQRTKEAGYKISNPCQDAILIRELDKEVGTFKIYNFAFRNCQWWVTLRYNIGMDYNQPCCNPDGTRYEKS